jgi:hypothetical protein
MSPSQAKSTFRDMLKKAKEESQKEGTSTLARNFGDILLEKESTDEKTKLMLARKRKEGVRDEDIRWWWNLHDLERRIMLAVDNLHRMAMFIHSMEEGMEENEAAARIRKYHPDYGNPEDTSHTCGDDRPLPYELKDRINIYIQKRSRTDPEEYKREIESSSSFNVLIRKEINKGNL